MASSATSRRGSAAARAEPAESDWVVDAYRSYFGYVFALLGRLGVPAANLEDVAQEVFLVLHRRRHEFRNDSSVRTWLHGIALHKGRRHRERVQRALDPSHRPPAPPQPRTPEEAVSAKRDLERLDALLDGLTGEQREVFVLVEIAELPVPEIAELLGVKLNTAYSRLRLARAAVRGLIDRMRDAAREGGVGDAGR